ncbi:amylo-alpha-1,6-glucosidase [Salmonirosea aquatica]|uniref:Glycogen debranching protein n=1 Tax=Salmonirosea aquatica TaxID=2654236 RepID=A0A7C9FNM1_9BACT|nr:glycogen debranching protein [Cytophagaceae bacterium SJW1-29]
MPHLTHPAPTNSWNKNEWLITNGLGGYASSTPSGRNTRRYHGLLVASFDPPTNRRVLVSKVEETVTNEADISFELFTNQAGTEGNEFLVGFEVHPFPTQRFETDGIALSKSLCMVQNSNTTVLEYSNIGAQTLALKINIVLVNRDYHSLQKKDAGYLFTTHNSEAVKQITASPGAKPLYLGCDEKFFWTEIGAWKEGFEYGEEQERGLDFREDCYTVGAVSRRLEPGEKCYLTFSTEANMARADGQIFREKALDFYQNNTPATDDIFLNDLIRAGQQFLVHRQSTDSASLIAGYHWFTDWGRDTMIAMRGLCIALGKKAESESLLRTFLHYLDRGMIPNRFPDVGQTPEYNTIDATLWLFVILHDFHERFSDLEFIAEVFPKLTEIIEYHRAGTRYDIHVTKEGLLFGGEGLVQLTWMDARMDDFVPTPRHGCPVEINALWYNALMIHQKFSQMLKLGDGFTDDIRLFVENFVRFFYNEQGYLHDVVVPHEKTDPSIRPNMIYAVSLPYTTLTREQQKGVVLTVQQHLLTDYGLRTLSPGHPDFQPVYGGGRYQRDAAYHQGTVWPYLLGDFIEAYLKVHDEAPHARAQARIWLKPLEIHFYEENCLHGISEVFDGLTPRIGKGTIHQAWSVAALIRCLLALQN